MNGNAYTPAEITSIRELVADGWTKTRIARLLNRSACSVESKIKAMRQEGLLPRIGNGSPPSDEWNPATVRHQSLAFAIDGARFFGREL